jgi:hypothetical protein
LEESCGGGSDGGGGGGGSNGGGFMKPMVRLEIGVTRMQVSVPHTHWRQFGANKSDASSEYSNIRVQCLASKQSSICAADRFYLWRR